MQNKKILFLSSGLLTLIILIFVLYNITNINNNPIIIGKISKIEYHHNNTISLMYETGLDTEEYEKSTSNTWPGDDYIFNSTLSGCENGGKLSWNQQTNKITLLNNTSDRCYIYFDVYNKAVINNVTNSVTTDSITVNVSATAGENPIVYYFYSINNGEYVSSASNTYTFSGLSAGTNYNIRVYALDTLGIVSNTYTIDITTEEYINPVVNSVSTTNVTSSSITVSVNATNGTNNIQTYYYSINNGSSYVSSTSNTYTFSGLSGSTTYNFRVYVVDSGGVQSNYGTTSGTTLSPTLANWVIELYGGVQGNNGIYHHTSSLANSAGDNSYRYAGANPNNYVCFGTDASTCPSDNLYRIIGVFDGEVKLIKNTSIGFYYYSGGNNFWDIGVEYDIETTLKTFYNNTVYIANNIWQNKISIHDFYVGGMSYSNGISTPKTVYNYEVGANQVSVSVRSMNIGLMYVSDYFYAADTNFWTYPGYTTFFYPDANGNYGSSYDYRAATGSNWMYSGLDEWSITRDSSTSNRAFIISTDGSSGRSDVARGRYTRPVFYLNSNVAYISGTGTSSDPIRIQ